MSGWGIEKGECSLDFFSACCSSISEREGRQLEEGLSNKLGYEQKIWEESRI